jgi:hypothetical protein
MWGWMAGQPADRAGSRVVEMEDGADIGSGVSPAQRTSRGGAAHGTDGQGDVCMYDSVCRRRGRQCTAECGGNRA